MSDPDIYFGQHKGKSFSEIPTGYLTWLWKAKVVKGSSRRRLATELRARGVNVKVPREKTPEELGYETIPEELYRVEGFSSPLSKLFHLSGKVADPSILAPWEDDPDLVSGDSQ